MYEKINKKLDFTENHLRALSLFTRGFDREYYIREVQRMLKISPRTAQLILENLEKKAVLESKARGKIKTYRIKKSDISAEYMVFAEHYKKLAFIQDKPFIGEIMSKITPYAWGIALIFGSYAKGLETKDSDLDVFIAGMYNKGEIKKISRTYGIEISVKNYTMNTFEKNIRDDILIREVKDSHIVFLNAEQFVKMALKNGQDTMVLKAKERN